MGRQLILTVLTICVVLVTSRKSLVRNVAAPINQIASIYLRQLPQVTETQPFDLSLPKPCGVTKNVVDFVDLKVW